MTKLTSAKVRSVSAAGVYGDGGGLYLQVRTDNRKTWIFRFRLHGRSRWMGLGPYPDVGLAEARIAAQEARNKVRQGIDPIDERQAERAKQAAERGDVTFTAVGELYLKSHRAAWRNAKHKQQWANTLATYVDPAFGKKLVSQVETGDVMKVLEPLWLEKPETASRLRGRIEAILDFARVRGWRTGENPARWRGHLDHLLPARAKVQRVEHHAALPWREVGAFMAELRKQDGISALALQFAVLTAARTGEVIGARWCEIDMAAKLWTVPAERMKAGREHRVPLSDAALSVLRTVTATMENPDPDSRDSFVFTGRKARTGLSQMALLMTLRRMDRGDLTAHGFRSTFRDWCAEATNYPREIAEAALAHTLRDKTEAAYQRADLIEKRRQLMQEWGSYCSRPTPAGEVVPIRATIG